MENIEKVTRLNVGCGNNYIDGYINIDVVEAFRADVRHDLSKPLPYETNTIDYIKAKDILEHFSLYDSRNVLRDWVRVLKYNGELELTVPNIQTIRDFDGEIFLRLMFGDQHFAGVDTGNYGLHKWGYYPDSLRLLLETNGMEIIDLHADGTNIYCLSKKVGQLLHAK